LGIFLLANKSTKDYPDYLGFKIINKVDDKAYLGKIIVYRIKPLLGIEMEWVTEITQVEELRSFIDVQLSGPYKIWHHEHRFEACSEGTIITDLLYYQLPFGWLGDLIHSLFIRKKVQQIFDYREVVLKSMFNKPPESKVSNVF
jgi:ligand-binding SRPBCC domain-containing protein